MVDTPDHYSRLVDLRDDQPGKHEIGNRTFLVADVEPLDVDGVRTVEVGTGVWLVAFVALLPFYGELQTQGRTWWLWTCLTGFGLGLLGLEYCRRRRATRRELDEQAHGTTDDGPAAP